MGCDRSKKDTREDLASISLYSYKEGELSSIDNFMILNVKYHGEKDILSGFIKSYYSEIDNVSSIIYVPVEIEEKLQPYQMALELKEKKVSIKVPKQAEKEILNMAAKTQYYILRKRNLRRPLIFQSFQGTYKLKEFLGLKKVPRRIECFDISNIGPDFAVGSMAVLPDGSLLYNYRHFRIKSVADRMTLQ